MADIAITAANVLRVSGGTLAILKLGSGVTGTQGQYVYEDTTVSPAVLRLSDANVSTATAVCRSPNFSISSARPVTTSRLFGWETVPA